MKLWKGKAEPTKNRNCSHLKDLSPNLIASAPSQKISP